MDSLTKTKVNRSVGLLDSDSLAEQVFRVVTRQIGATGWEIAREVHKSPKHVEQALAELVQHEVVKADGRGLSAYYSPSGQAYLVLERLAG